MKRVQLYEVKTTSIGIPRFQNSLEMFEYGTPPPPCIHDADGRYRFDAGDISIRHIPVYRMCKVCSTERDPSKSPDIEEKWVAISDDLLRTVEIIQENPEYTKQYDKLMEAYEEKVKKSISLRNRNTAKYHLIMDFVELPFYRKLWLLISGEMNNHFKKGCII